MNVRIMSRGGCINRIECKKHRLPSKINKMQFTLPDPIFAISPASNRDDENTVTARGRWIRRRFCNHAVRVSDEEKIEGLFFVDGGHRGEIGEMDCLSVVF
jgi:hypothetical protein